MVGRAIRFHRVQVVRGFQDVRGHQVDHRVQEGRVVREVLVGIDSNCLGSYRPVHRRMGPEREQELDLRNSLDERNDVL